MTTIFSKAFVKETGRRIADNPDPVSNIGLGIGGIYGFSQGEGALSTTGTTVGYGLAGAAVGAGMSAGMSGAMGRFNKGGWKKIREML
jgi:hypothetical protein